MSTIPLPLPCVYVKNIYIKKDLLLPEALATVFVFEDSLMSKSQKSRSMSEGTGLVVVTSGFAGSGLIFEDDTSGELSSPVADEARLLGVWGVRRSLTIFLMSMSERWSVRRRRLTLWPGPVSSSRVWFSHSSTRGSTLTATRINAQRKEK